MDAWKSLPSGHLETKQMGKQVPAQFAGSGSKGKAGEGEGSEAFLAAARGKMGRRTGS